MGIRERINTIPPVYLIVATIVLLGVCGYMLFAAVRRPGDPTLSQVMTLKCANCGQVEMMTRKEVISKATVNDVSPLAPSITCPKCNQQKLAYAVECPRDGTVFISRVAAKAGAQQSEGEVPTIGVTCPKCGWDPAGEKDKQLEELLKKGGK